MRILLTGASGFLGSQLAKSLAERGHLIRGVIRTGNDEQIKEYCRLGVARVDLRSTRDLRVLLEGIETVVHLAAAVTGTADQQFSATVVGTERLLEAMAAMGVKALVLASSFSVYDWSSIKGTLSEETQVDENWRARDGYAVAKIWQERLCRRYADKFGWSLGVLRPGFIWGKPGELIPGIGQRLGSRVLIVIAPLSRLPTTHVVNCASVFASATEIVGGGTSMTVNVVDDYGLSTWRLAKLTTADERVLMIPLPYIVSFAAVSLIETVLRRIFGREARLPSILIARRFQARFMPVTCSLAELMKQLPGYRPKPLRDLSMRDVTAFEPGEARC